MFSSFPGKFQASPPLGVDVCGGLTQQGLALPQCPGSHALVEFPLLEGGRDIGLPCNQWDMMEGIGRQCRDYIALAWNLCLTSRSFLLPFWFSCFVGINCHVGKIPMGGNGRLRLLDSQQGTEALSSTGCKELNPSMSLESDLAQSLGFQKRPQLWPTPSFEAT